MVDLEDLVELVAGPVGGAVFLDPAGDGFEDQFALFLARGVVEEGPLGVEPDVFYLMAAGEFVSPFGDGSFILHDDLQFVGLGQVFVQWEGLPLGGEGDPVEVAVNGEGAAGLEVDGKGTDAEGVGEVVEIVDGGFATREDDDLAAGGEGVLGEGIGIGLLDVGRDVVGVPGAGGIAPWALHGAALEAYEVGGLAEVAALALPGVETFVDGERVHGR